MSVLYLVRHDLVGLPEYIKKYWCPVNLFHKSKKNGADLAQKFAPNCAFLYCLKKNAHNEQKYLF